MKKKGKYILILILLVIVVTAIPLFLSRFDYLAGTDDAAGAAVAAVDPNYKPWAKPVLEFSNGKTETLMFSLQAGIGAVVLGLGFGYLVFRKKKEKGND